MKLEQQQNKNEIYAEEYKKAKTYLLELFNTKDPKKIDNLYFQIQSSAHLVGLEAEFIVEQLKKCFDLENPEDFVDSSFKVLKNLIDKKIEHPELWEKIRRERIIQQSGNIRLSEIMYYQVDIKNSTAILHVGPRGDLSMGAIIKAFRDGMKELAREVNGDERIKNILATSWIVAQNPGLLEKAGFEVEGPIDEETKAKHFSDENRPVSSAHMSREKLLEKYL